MKANYHTHCYLCGHAEGRVEDYVAEAVNRGLTELGISDHVPYPGDAFDERMTYDKFYGYIEEIDALKAKYKDKIHVLAGVESEYFPDFAPYYERIRNDLDYMILGQHFFRTDNRNIVNCFVNVTDSLEYVIYANSCVEAMKTGLYDCLCHPDLIFLNDIASDKNTRKAIDIIVDAAVKYDFVLELNANGFRRGIRKYADGDRYPYPYAPLWEAVAASKVRTIIGSDCHSPSLLCDYKVAFAKDYADKLGINIISTLF